jgi:hypothetical protein
MQAVTFCAQPDVLRGSVQPMLSNQPSLSVEMNITVTRPRCPRHHSVQK